MNEDYKAGLVILIILALVFFTGYTVGKIASKTIVRDDSAECSSYTEPRYYADGRKFRAEWIERCEKLVEYPY